jgi:hypothetical protein
MQSASATRTTSSNSSPEAHQPFASADVNWPNFFIVGAHKGGTSYLYTHLRRHPEIFLPTHKEPAYFQPGSRTYVELDEYRALYAGAKGYKAIGEATPYYLPDPEVPPRIQAVSPAAKIIAVLRDPVERAYSHYQMDRELDCVESFREAIERYEDKSARRWSLSQEYIEWGLYHAQVRRYFDTFGRDQALVLPFTDIRKRPNDLLSTIARFLGVDPGFYAGLDVAEPIFRYRKPKFAAAGWFQRSGLTILVPNFLKRAAQPLFFNTEKPAMDAETRRRLQQLYEPDVAGLEELLGRKLPELRESWI